MIEPRPTSLKELSAFTSHVAVLVLSIVITPAKTIRSVSKINKICFKSHLLLQNIPKPALFHQWGIAIVPPTNDGYDADM